MADVTVTKKDIQEAKRPDAVLEGATSVYDWLVAKRNLVIGALIALLLIIAGVSFAQASSENKKREVGAKLASALELAQRPVVENKEGVTPPADGKSFPTEEAKSAAVDKALTDIVQQHSGTEAARTAELTLADRRLSAGKTDEAIAGYEKYLGEVGTGGLRLFAIESLGYAYEAKGDTAKAESTFARLGDEGALGLATFHKARLTEKAGKKDEAKKLYEQIAKDYSTENVANEARTRLELIDVPPAGTGELKAVEPAPPEEPKKGKKKPARKVPAKKGK